MSDNGSTWPEQDIVYEWLEKHGIDAERKQALELMETFTHRRVELQSENAELKRQIEDQKKFYEQVNIDICKEHFAIIKELQVKLAAVEDKPNEKLQD